MANFPDMLEVGSTSLKFTDFLATPTQELVSVQHHLVGYISVIRCIQNSGPITTAIHEALKYLQGNFFQNAMDSVHCFLRLVLCYI
jgi:hypothetical protein